MIDKEETVTIPRLLKCLRAGIFQPVCFSPSNSVNFQTGKDKIDYCNNHEDDEDAVVNSQCWWWWSVVGIGAWVRSLFVHSLSAIYDQSNHWNDFKRTRHVAVNFPYFFNAADVLLSCLDLEENPHGEVWDHENEWFPRLKEARLPIHHSITSRRKGIKCIAYTWRKIITSKYSDDGKNNSKHG